MCVCFFLLWFLYIWWHLHVCQAFRFVVVFKLWNWIWLYLKLKRWKMFQCSKSFFFFWLVNTANYYWKQFFFLFILFFLFVWAGWTLNEMKRKKIAIYIQKSQHWILLICFSIFFFPKLFLLFQLFEYMKMVLFLHCMGNPSKFLVRSVNVYMYTQFVCIWMRISEIKLRFFFLLPTLCFFIVFGLCVCVCVFGYFEFDLLIDS